MFDHSLEFDTNRVLHPRIEITDDCGCGEATVSPTH